MRETRTILTLLQVAVPANTLLTVPAEVKILEILGIVSNPELVRAMNLSLSLIPSTTTATMKGLVQLLNTLMRMNPKSTKGHHASLDKLVASVAGSTDVPLTFGTFLPICESLLDARKKLSGDSRRTRARDEPRGDSFDQSEET